MEGWKVGHLAQADEADDKMDLSGQASWRG